MAKYCVVNFQKNKKSSVKNLQKEANREWEDLTKYKSEIDPDFENIYFKKSDDWMKSIDEVLEKNDIKKYRKDAVLLTTSVYGYSQEWEDELKSKYGDEKAEEVILSYFEKCFEFEQTRGECVNFVIHTDESGNYHAHAATVPITSDGKLSAKEIFGNRKKMSDEQTRFYEMAGKPFGLERGEMRLMDKAGAVRHLNETEYRAKQEKDNALRVSDELKLRAKNTANKIITDAKQNIDERESSLNARETSLDAREETLRQKEGETQQMHQKALKTLSEVSELYQNAKDESDFVRYVKSKKKEIPNFVEVFDKVYESYEKDKENTKEKTKARERALRQQGEELLQQHRNNTHNKGYNF